MCDSLSSIVIRRSQLGPVPPILAVDVRCREPAVFVQSDRLRLAVTPIHLDLHRIGRYIHDSPRHNHLNPLGRISLGDIKVVEDRRPILHSQV